MLTPTKKYVKNGKQGDVLGFYYTGGSKAGVRLVKATVVDNNGVEGIDLLGDSHYKKYSSDKIVGKPVLVGTENDVVLSLKDLIHSYNLPATTNFYDALKVAQIFNPQKNISKALVEDVYFAVVKGEPVEKVEVERLPGGNHEVRLYIGTKQFAFTVSSVNGKVYKDGIQISVESLVDRLSDWY